MTVEEALLAVVGAVALVLLFLGLADALEGDPRTWLRGRRRRLARPDRLRPGLTLDAGTPMARRATPPPPASLRPAPGAAERAAPAAAPTAPGAPPREGSRATVTEEWRTRVAALVRGRECGEARQLLASALERGELERETAGFLLDVCSTAVARNLWRLRRAVRRGGDEAPLEGSLEVTRVMLEASVAQDLPREQRRRGTDRLWRGHTRLGLRRWRAGTFEAAVGSLFQALGVRGIDEGRRRLARDLLVRTLEDMAGQSLELIPQLLGEGDRAIALGQAQRLREHIHRAREEGVSAEDVAVAAVRARQLLEHIEHTPVR